MSQCAIDCLDQAASANGCDVSDTFCVCTHQDVVTAAVNCALNSCTTEDVNTVPGLFKTECESEYVSSMRSPRYFIAIVPLDNATLLYSKVPDILITIFTVHPTCPYEVVAPASYEDYPIVQPSEHPLDIRVLFHSYQ
ncbi:hypothetical protein GSI_11162 [Ganoderma sinense ZZ0214-1]|uniref:CFEM domain-containing protein n=1 Tax=Ganoderma sinense ZZ0214-1 TaxID=1077348 RepID=A0A2G8RZL6_9APHY|nr:hypothetical protein GSI_11162 [Ganoderma sinense ZZ0214-1]